MRVKPLTLVLSRKGRGSRIPNRDGTLGLEFEGLFKHIYLRILGQPGALFLARRKPEFSGFSRLLFAVIPARVRD